MQLPVHEGYEALLKTVNLVSVNKVKVPTGASLLENYEGRILGLYALVQQSVCF